MTFLDILYPTKKIKKKNRGVLLANRGVIWETAVNGGFLHRGFKNRGTLGTNRGIINGGC